MAHKALWTIVGVIALSCPYLCADAQGQSVPALQRTPTANVLVEGRGSAYSVQFDRPIDHLRSTLAIMRESTLVETLTPLADSRPEVLFARAPTLPPGEYKLHWQVKTLDNVDTVEGDFAFKVTR